MLIDTDVLIWYLRGNQKALEILENRKSFSISVITYMELVQGMRDKRELRILRASLREWNAHMIYISEEISIKAMFYVEDFFHKQALQAADALIGATAVIHGIPILTANDKHYRVIRDLELNIFRP